jgi:hypothetical protein
MMVSDIWLYIKAVVVFTTKGTCFLNAVVHRSLHALAEMFGNVSHDRLTRVLMGNFKGKLN